MCVDVPEDGSMNVERVLGCREIYKCVYKYDLNVLAKRSIK